MHSTTSGRSGHAYNRPFTVRAEARRVAMSAPAPALGLGGMLHGAGAQLRVEAAHRPRHPGPPVLGRPAPGPLAEPAAPRAPEPRRHGGGQPRRAAPRTAAAGP